MARPAYSVDERERIETEIRKAALSLFASKGYRNVSLRAIAGRLDWSATALYRYYDSKGALLTAIRAEGFSQLGAILAEVRGQTASPVEMTRNAVKAYLRFAMEKSDVFQLMFELDQQEFQQDTEVLPNRRAAFAEAQGIADDILLDTGLKGDRNEMAHLLWIGAHGLATLAVANQLDLGKDYQDLVEPLVQMLLSGMLTQEES